MHLRFRSSFLQKNVRVTNPGVSCLSGQPALTYGNLRIANRRGSRAAVVGLRAAAPGSIRVPRAGRTPSISVRPYSFLSFVNADGCGGEDIQQPASGVANVDTTELLLGMLLLLVGAGVAYCLLPRRTQPVPNVRQSPIQQDFRRQAQIQRDSARLFHDERTGEEALIKRWMDHSGCDRTEAMRLATEEWRRDNC
jgi:hypothetical protein